MNKIINSTGTAWIEKSIDTDLLYQNADKFNLTLFNTDLKHAREYGFISVEKPLYLAFMNVLPEYRLQGYGTKLLKYIEAFARLNYYDIVFGHIKPKSEFTKDDRITTFSDVEIIKYWLHDRGWAVNNDNNDFHKVINP